MLIRKVEQFLRDHNMAATKFGRLAARDPRFVLDLRMGRTPRPATVARTLEWMERYTPPPALPGAAHASAKQRGGRPRANTASLSHAPAAFKSAMTNQQVTHV